MSKAEAVSIADAFILRARGASQTALGARRFDSTEWTVTYETLLPDPKPGAIVDGPTLVTVDVATKTANYLGLREDHEE